MQNILFLYYFVYYALLCRYLCVLLHTNNLHYIVYIMQISKVIKAHGLSQMEVAQRMGISRQGLANALQRGEAVSFSTLRAIASAVGCSVVEFFADEDNTPRQEPSQGAYSVCPKCGAKLTLTMVEE